MYGARGALPGSSEMKVVLFCGGLGMRIREYSEDIPKPMVPSDTGPSSGT
jgi:hypothetical protein